MSNVTLEISGRRYRIACAEGEESHIEQLGTFINGKLSALSGLSSQSEARTLLFAALLLADELHEAEGKKSSAQELAMAEPLENMAERLESLATHLESGQASA